MDYQTQTSPAQIEKADSGSIEKDRGASLRAKGLGKGRVLLPAGNDGVEMETGEGDTGTEFSV